MLWYNFECISSSFPLCASLKKVIFLFSRAVLGTKYAHLESKNSRISLNLCWFLYPFIPSGWLSGNLAILLSGRDKTKKHECWETV